jgi:hypothetical protein
VVAKDGRRMKRLFGRRLRVTEPDPETEAELLRLRAEARARRGDDRPEAVIAQLDAEARAIAEGQARRSGYWSRGRRG